MKAKVIVARNPEELARIFGLTPADAAEWEARRQINDKIIVAMKESGMTHAQVAKAASTSRTRVTAIVNRNRSQVSTDLMIRILAALGYRTKISFTRARRAA